MSQTLESNQMDSFIRRLSCNYTKESTRHRTSSFKNIILKFFVPRIPFHLEKSKLHYLAGQSNIKVLWLWGLFSKFISRTLRLWIFYKTIGNRIYKIACNHQFKSLLCFQKCANLTLFVLRRQRKDLKRVLLSSWIVVGPKLRHFKTSNWDKKV